LDVAKSSEIAEREVLIVNPLIYAEVSVRFERIAELDAALKVSLFRRDALPWEAGFFAGKCFRRYRREGGARRSPLPDFYVGAHAAIRDHRLLTRDASRYRTYFPTLKLIAP
jgi:predicted nucleic acid-binding protein